MVTTAAVPSVMDPLAILEIQADVPVPSYATGGWQMAAFDYLNDRRGQCGFGKLAQATALDQAAQAHAAYVANVLNDPTLSPMVTSFHDQDPSFPLFSGVTPTERARSFGYGGVAGEVIAWGESDLPEPDTAELARLAKSSLQDLLAAPYHMKGIMAGMREVGFGMSTWREPDELLGFASRSALAVVPGSGVPGYAQRSTIDTLTYPCEGTTDVAETMPDETPDPTQGHGIQWAGPAGPAILVVAPDKANVSTPTGVPSVPRLSILAARLTPQARLDGKPLGDLSAFELQAPYPSGMLLLNQSTDKQGMISRGEDAFLVPHAALESGVTYRAEIEFTVDGGAAQSRVFLFSTRRSSVD
jgi:uncharacterized protein YkwD